MLYINLHSHKIEKRLIINPQLKNTQVMKTTKFFYLLMMFAGIMTFNACSSDDDNGGASNPIEESYFTIEEGTFVADQMPTSTTDASLDGVYCNNQALSNGGNFITISSTTEYDRFYVGIDGIDGYYDIDAASLSTRADGQVEYFTYTIPLYYSVDLGDNFTLVISGVTVTGYITQPYTQEITHVESLSGDLLINLVFDQPKDVDLHLIMPSGREIYYGNRGDYGEDENGNYVQLFGLDHDSNPACNIDNLNNENISIPAEFVQKGEYTVIVNLYSNCDHSVPVNYSLQARYKGNLLENLLDGANPIRGYYAANASNHDRTVVMKFKLTEGIDVENEEYNPEEPANQRRMLPLTPSAKAKLMMKE